MAIQLPDSQECTAQAGCDDSFFEEALATALDGCHSRAANVVAQEQLCPCDGVSRIPVPIVDFEIAKPPWVHGLWTARQHLSWLVSDAPTVLHVPCVPSDCLLDSTLKWAPVPRGQGVVVTAEALRDGAADWHDSPAEERERSPRSAMYISVWSSPLVLGQGADDEMQIPDEDLGAAIDDDESAVRSDSLLDDCIEAMRPSLRRPAEDCNAALLDLDGVFSTGKLLDDFLQLRAVKRPRVSTPEAARQHAAPGNTTPPSAPSEPQPLLDGGLTPAAVPCYQVPDRKGLCIVSLALGTQVIRHLDAAWPSQLLVDRDFASFSAPTCPLGDGRPSAALPVLAHEADVCLTPTVGVIVTSLAKVRQRPLPGSKDPVPLQDRVSKVSQKYEKLIILISESNLAGEFAGDLSPADLASYADFAGFAACLETEASTFLVPGASHTLAQWILALMSRYSAQTAALAGLVAPEETTWEVFLRRAGASAMAALVLSRSLAAEFGDEGLARFLLMEARARSAKYAPLLGSQRALEALGARLDAPWP